MHQHKQKNVDLFFTQLNDFGAWLLSQRGKQIPLSRIAERTLHTFSMEYCSIRVLAKGPSHNLSGISANKEVADSLPLNQDHLVSTLELAEEQSLGVRNFEIRTGDDSLALLAVKSSTLSNEAIKAIATMIAFFLFT